MIYHHDENKNDEGKERKEKKTRLFILFENDI